MNKMREQFEAWHTKHFGWCNDETWPESGDYCDTLLQSRWESWQAATEAAKATGTAQTKQSFENIEELVPLPEPQDLFGKGYRSTDMRAYGQQCAEAARQPAPVVARFSISEAQKNMIRRAADTLDGLDYEDTAGDLRDILRSQP